MPLDFRTLVTVAALTSGLVALALAFAMRAQPERLRGSVRAWTLGIAVQALGWLLVGFHDLWPDAVTIVFANLLVTAGYTECVQALRLFGQRRRLDALYALPGAVLVTSIAFTWIWPDRPLRMAVNSVLLTLVFAIASVITLRLRAPGSQRTPGQWLVASVFVLGTTMLLVRTVGLAFETPPLPGAGGVAPLQLMLYLWAALGPAIATFGFSLMLNDLLNAELERLATLDPLTGVYNRRSIEDFATRAIAAARRHGHKVSVLLVDADHFKRINDEMGHEAGDSALRTLVGVLRLNARREDAVGRMGGEEFVVLMPDTDEAAGVAGAERLRAAVEAARFAVGTQRVPLRVSIGVAALRDARDDFPMLVRRADRALYEAKRGGRNRVEPASRHDGRAVA
jgi:diguanylate cyclase (GGDEF)-like protein